MFSSTFSNKVTMEREVTSSVKLIGSFRKQQEGIQNEMRQWNDIKWFDLDSAYSGFKLLWFSCHYRYIFFLIFLSYCPLLSFRAVAFCPIHNGNVELFLTLLFTVPSYLFEDFKSLLQSFCYIKQTQLSIFF